MRMSYTPYLVHYTLHPIPYTRCPMMCIRHPMLMSYTPYLVHYTLHPIPYTRCPIMCIRHPMLMSYTPYLVHYTHTLFSPIPELKAPNSNSTPNSQPYTLEPDPKP